ncbi:uncharacterized protein LOC143043215 [Mytilus galloprovincialis]|uniref:uncharacterized protein LOC143043215 n=1 Tax=Mytilus galloprovincialis TaxID=29158 RepID=UPI003F7BB9E9
MFASTLKCESHNLEYVHYCKNCKCLTCSACTTTVHKGHDFTNMTEIAASAREDLKQTNCNVKSKLKILSALIDEIENVKMKNLQKEINQFVEEARIISDELVRIIKSVAEQNVNRATDFLTNEQQGMNFELAKLKKIQKDYSSITEKIDQLIQMEHDMTFYVQQKLLTKDFVETESIPTVADPENIGEFKINDFIDQVVENIQSKYSVRCLNKKDGEIEKLKKKIDEERINISEMQTIRQEITKQSALLQKEKSKIKELENENMKIQRSNTISFNEMQEIINNTSAASKNIQIKYEEIRRAVEEKEYLLKAEQDKTAVLEEQRNEILRMRRKTEEELTKLKDEYNDVKHNITSFTGQHDKVNIKNREEIDRLKFQVECMMKQHTMLPPVNMIGFSECKQSFKSMIMLVAIEVGTLFSGCCCSFKGLHKDSDKHGFVSPQLYTEQKLNKKIPTALLLNSKKEFECFGVDAENHYRQEEESENCFYFTRFKTMLFRSKDEKSEIQMKTLDGTKELPAWFIYSLTIKYFKDVIKNSMERGDLRKDDVGWIITLPPSATAETQQIMIQAAIEAGISKRNLLIVSETDALVALCRSENVQPNIQGFDKVLILDLGSGSFDVSVCEVQKDQSLNIQLNFSFPAVGWPQVRDVFEEMFIGIVGNKVYQQYCNECPEDRRKWLEYIFLKICSLSDGQKGYVTLELPMDLQNVLYKETGKEFAELICQSKFTDSLIGPANDKIKIRLPVWNKLFDIPVDQIKYYVNQVTEMGGMESLNNIIITGGIIQSETIQLRIKELFPDKNIIIPTDVEFAVLRGAITIGMN